MNSKLKLQSGFVIAFAVLVAVGYTVFAFFPKMRAIRDIRQQIHQKQDFISQTAKLRPVVAQQKAELTSTTNYVAEQRGRLVRPAQLSQVFGTISQLAKDSGTVTTKFEPQPPVNYDSFRKVPLTLGVAGKTADVEKLLADIERMSSKVAIDGVKLDADSQNSQAVKCEVDLVVFVDNREISN